MSDLTTKVTLADGYEMPLQGLGLYKVTSQAELTGVVQSAWESGYRLFDTAQMYKNEGMLGAAIKELSLPRDEMFVTTKVAEANQGYDATLASVEASLRELDMD